MDGIQSAIDGFITTLEPYMQFITIGVYVILGIIAVIFIVNLFKSGFKNAIFKLLGLVLSVLIAYFGTKIIICNFAEQIFMFVVDVFKIDFGSLLTDAPSIKIILPTFVGGVIAPLLFLIIFILVRLIIIIVKFIVKLLTPKDNNDDKKNIAFGSRFIGAIVLIICFVLHITVYVFPIASYGYFISDNRTQVDKVISTYVVEDDTKKAINGTLNLLDNDVVKIVLSYSGFIFDDLATVTTQATKDNEVYKESGKGYDSYTLNCFDALGEVIDMIDPIDKCLKIDFSNFENIDTTPLKEIADKINTDDLTFIREIIAEVLAKAGSAWCKGEAYFGVNLKEEINKKYPDYVNILDGALQRFANTDRDKVVDDLKAFADAITTAMKTLTYTNTMNAGAKPVDELSSSLKDILSTITTDSIDMLSSVFDTSVIEEMGVKSDTAQVVSTMIDLALTKIADINEGKVEGDIGKEAEALNNLLVFANDTTLEVQPQAVLEGIMESNVIKSVINDYAVGEDITTIQLGNSEMEDIETAITTYETENSGKVGYEGETIESLKKIFGIGSVQ